MNDAYFETIHRYLHGDMTPDERTAFEREIETNESLRQALDLERSMLETLETVGDRDLRDTIRGVHRKLDGEGFFAGSTVSSSPPLTVTSNRSALMKRILPLAVAASVLFILGIFWFTTGRNSQPDPDALFAKYFRIDQEQLRQQIAALESYGMAGVKTEQDSLRDALLLFEQGNYAASIKLLTPLLKDHPDNETAQYYLGLAQLSESRYARAVELLEPLTRSATFAQRNEAKWNLGLCYLKVEGGMRLTLQIFRELSLDNEFPRHREAGAMYDMLK